MKKQLPGKRKLVKTGAKVLAEIARDEFLCCAWGRAVSAADAGF